MIAQPKASLQSRGLLRKSETHLPAARFTGETPFPLYAPSALRGGFFHVILSGAKNPPDDFPSQSLPCLKGGGPRQRWRDCNESISTQLRTWRFRKAIRLFSCVFLCKEIHERNPGFALPREPPAPISNQVGAVLLRACRKSTSNHSRCRWVGDCSPKSLPCARGGAPKGRRGCYRLWLSHKVTTPQSRYHSTAPLAQGSHFLHKRSGSGIPSGNPYDNILSKNRSVWTCGGGGGPALESRARVFSYNFYKKYRRKKANDLSSAPGSELSAATFVWGRLFCGTLWAPSPTARRGAFLSL